MIGPSVRPYGTYTYNGLFVCAEILVDILRNCEFQVKQLDDIIIRQGERGDWYKTNAYSNRMSGLNTFSKRNTHETSSD